MNNEVTLKASKNSFSNLLFVSKSPLKWLSSYYGQVLERPINIRQTLHLLHAQVAAFMTIFPVNGPMFFRLFCLFWLVSAVLKCRTALQNIR